MPPLNDNIDDDHNDAALPAHTHAFPVLSDLDDASLVPVIRVPGANTQVT